MFENWRKNRKKENKEYTDVDKMAATLPNMSKSEIPTDVLGSYTGTARDGEKPDQDADDL
ncbi:MULTISPECIES: hypothetical protein [Eubacteriales]|jgi:hypothetical protein|uniref:hypothetical protein n=1 Tax=Eubacteriales TaxID=186802 RepID=UPI00056FAAF0|nr:MULTISPECIES: hypothetical protein [Eubacteriales]MDF1494173.1 hypothetical protein [Caproiciproducens sp. CPB-2]TQI69118.1 hypothetical protein LY85_3870 [Clostridium sp. KNHs216]